MVNMENKMKKLKTNSLLIALLGLSLLFTACSSNKKKEKVPRKFAKKTYKLLDASLVNIPDWFEDEESRGNSKEKKKYFFFVSESMNRSKRLCSKSAQARATAKIAGEISQFVKNSYAESTQDDADEGVVEYMEETLGQEAQAYIVGARVTKTYWEQRAYLKELGASKNKEIYNCYALVQISKKQLQKAIKNSTAKLYKHIQNPEVKENTKKVLSEIDKKFR